MMLAPTGYLSFSAVCRGLPHLRPRNTQALLRAALQGGRSDLAIGRVAVTGKELAELFVPIVRDGYPTRAVSPAGAALMVRLYQAGALDTAGEAPADPAPELLAYSRGEGPWLELARGRNAMRAAYGDKLAAPESVDESEFTPRLLDDLFRRHCGRGEARMEIGGRIVRRCPVKQVGEGRSMVFALVFQWTGADGQPRELSVTSRYSGIWSN